MNDKDTNFGSTIVSHRYDYKNTFKKVTKDLIEQKMCGMLIKV